METSVMIDKSKDAVVEMASSEGPSLKLVRSLLAIAHWQVMEELPEGRAWLGICIFAGGIFVVESGDQSLNWRSLGSLKEQPNLMWTGVGDSFWVRTDWRVSTFFKPGIANRNDVDHEGRRNRELHWISPFQISIGANCSM